MARFYFLGVLLAVAGCTGYPVQLSDAGQPVTCQSTDADGNPVCHPVRAAPENYKPSKNR
jgi:hypothetical protein